MVVMARVHGGFVPLEINQQAFRRYNPTSFERSPEINHNGRVDQKDYVLGPSDRHVLDPYARSYVPQELKFINTREGETLHSSSQRQINFDAYVVTHIGSDFLPPIPGSSATQFEERSVDIRGENAGSTYEPYFKKHIEAEVKAQEKENEGYSLYAHDATISILANHEATCLCLVPGLRENSPYLEEGDVVDCRQLMYDSESQDPRAIRVMYTRPGRPFASTAGFHSGPSLQNLGKWTGVIFKARITHINRKQEQLLLKLEGAKPHLLKLDPNNTINGNVHCKFNIQFPIMTERYLPMYHVLPVIQHALRQSDQSSNGLKQPGKLNSNTLCADRNWVKSMLFPDSVDCAMQSTLNPGTFKREYYDPNLNWEQKKAVESVCLQDYGNLPFLISGPPGTGKTKTLVEIALQLVNKVDQICHLLFCAPSDPAADTLVQRLGKVCTPGELLRLNRPSRTFAEIPDAVLPFCYVSDQIFSIPPFRQLMKYKVVVTTTRDASILMYARVSNSDLYSAQYNLSQAIHPYEHPPTTVKLHWTALLVDEAAQAVEPEVLVPLSLIAPPGDVHAVPSPLFIMAGDEYQLGPHLAMHKSPLRTSLFARLFARSVYSSHPLARGKSGKAPPALNGAMLPILRPPFANLIRNYRSHPAILSVPSNLFYADTLEHHANDINRLSTWDGWKGKRWPVIFHNSSGEAEDELERDGGGWYNAIEAQIACRYAQKIMQTGLVQQTEICIMSPFKAQVNRLRTTIKRPEFGSLRDVDIGPTEVFQGLERGVVILCTTRSKERFVQDDQDLDWGIVGTPNKMNVALTRAKFGLIVIGKREVLDLDPNWRVFTSFCSRNGLWEGRDVNASSTMTDLNRLERVLLAEEETEVEKRKKKVLNVWSRGHSRAMGDEAMWADGMQAEEDDMGSTDDEDYNIDENDETLLDHDEVEDDAHGEASMLKDKNERAEDDDDEEDYEYHEALTGLRLVL